MSTRKEDTAIAGFSMGGVQALKPGAVSSGNVRLHDPISTGYFPAGLQQLEKDHADMLQSLAAHPFKQFNMGRGQDDKLTAANSTATLQMLDEYKIPHRYIELDGVHSFVFARRFLVEVLPLTFR